MIFFFLLDRVLECMWHKGLHEPDFSGPGPALLELISLLPDHWNNHLIFAGLAWPVGKITSHLRPDPARWKIISHLLARPETKYKISPQARPGPIRFN